MHLGGTDTEQGVAAGYQLAWTLARGQRNEEALRVADGLLGARGLGEMMRQNVRWAGARLASMTGDTRRARADYQALVDELSGQAQYAWIVKDATAQLAGLDK